MNTINIQFRDLTFPVITNDDRLDQETIIQGLDCLIPSQELIPTGVKLILVDCLNTPQGTQWTLHFTFDQDPDDPDFAKDFASDIETYILENEEDIPIVYKTIDIVYNTLTIIYHAG